MIYIRSAIFSVSYFCSTVSYGTLSILTWVLPARTRHSIVASWTTWIIFLLRIICGVKYSIQGVENIPQKNKPAMVLSKHQSAWETLFLQGAFLPASTILKKELLDIPFFGWGLRAMRPIAIDRSNPRVALKQVKEQGASRLSDGLNVIIFPEGTRMQPGERGKYARSGADIAIASQVDIIPVAINSGICWPANERFFKYPGTISVVIGKPISTENKNSKQLTAEVEEWIESEMSMLPKNISGS